MKSIATLILILSVLNFGKSQELNSDSLVKTLSILGHQKFGEISIGGYVDAYYGFNFNRPEDGNNPYFVSMSRHNEATINLAYLDLKYTQDRLRARIAPGFGTYMNANYAAEPGALKFLFEANAGVKLFKNKEIWVDFGVFGSPYTNETCVSRDHLMYTQSLAPEYVPYYLAGAKLSLPVNQKLNLYIYLLNGWQQIQDQNKGKSLGTQLEYKPNAKNLLNWNTYIGDERSAAMPDNRMRYFSDIFWTYNPDGKFTLSTCAYAGIQQRKTIGQLSNHLWWQANIVARYKFSKNISLAGRFEYFDDQDAVQITNINNPLSGFRAMSGGLCFNLNLFNNAMFRLEGRQFYSLDDAFKNKNADPTKWSSWLIGNLTVWF
jgi:hypothetical protein